MNEPNLKERTARGLFWGSVSSGVQQLLSLVIGIFLARRLLPEEYFMVAVLTVFQLLAANVQDSGFQNALAVKRHVVHRDYNAVFWFSIFSSLIMYAVLFAVAPLIARFNHTPQLTLLARVSFLGFVIASLGRAHSAYLFRNLMVKERMMATFVAVCLSGVVGIAMVYGGLSYWGLVGQDLTYKTVVMLMYVHLAPWRPTWHVNLSPVRRMYGFSSKILATNMLITINNQFLQSILGHYYPARDVGLYSQSNKWDTMGYSLVSGTTSSVAQPVLAGVSDDRERQQRVFRKMMGFTAFLSMPAMFGLAVIAPEFVPLALKEQWLPCVPYLQTLCVAGAFVPLGQLYSNLLVSDRRSGLFLLGTALMLLVQLALIVGLSLSGFGVQTLLYFVSAMQVGWLLVWHLLARRVVRLSFLSTLRDIAPFTLAAAAAMAAAWGVATLCSGTALKLVVKVVVAAAAYCVLMRLGRVQIYAEAREFLLQMVRAKLSRRSKPHE